LPADEEQGDGPGRCRDHGGAHGEGAGGVPGERATKNPASRASGVRGEGGVWGEGLAAGPDGPAEVVGAGLLAAQQVGGGVGDDLDAARAAVLGDGGAGRQQGSGEEE